MSASRFGAVVVLALWSGAAMVSQVSADEVRLDALEAEQLASSTPESPTGLSAERAQVLLRSLTVPGWGQATLGHKTSATVFFVADLAIWTSFAAFQVQSEMRTETYERTAQIFAGIDLSNRDEEYRRTVGSYISSEEYNQLVVYRDAANLYYDDPVAYREYIAQNSIGGENAWAWDSDENFLRFGSQRKDAQRADIRANTALAAAVVNRLLSALHAARIHGRPSSKAAAWEVRLAPRPELGEGALAIQVHTRF